eukprot:6190482-Pleurochrysis_carterae.AAC.2
MAWSAFATLHEACANSATCGIRQLKSCSRRPLPKRNPKELYAPSRIRHANTSEVPLVEQRQYHSSRIAHAHIEILTSLKSR